MNKIRQVIADQKGQALVEFSLVVCVYLALIFMIIVYSGWLYNSFQADRAARHGAIYVSTTGNATQAKAVAQDYLNKTVVLARVSNITVGSASTPTCRVQVEMTTFFPGIPKLLDSRNPMWADKIQIVKEATTPGEDKFTHSGNYN